MRNPTSIDLTLFLITLVAATGCGDDSSGADAISADAGIPDAPGEATTEAGPSCAAGEIAFGITFRDTDAGGGPLSGVHACAVSHPSIPCVDTGADGTWNACFPANAELALSYQKPGYMPTLIAVTTGSTPPSSPRLQNIGVRLLTAVCDHPWTQFDEACPPATRSLLFVRAVTNAPDDSTTLPEPLGEVTVEPPSSWDLGPLYEGVLGIDTSLTATDPESGNAFAAGVPAGDEEVVTLTHPTLSSCHGFSFDSWAGEDPATIRIPVRPGFRTFVPVTCE